jgi:LysR family transcriptional regulator, transcriptional activator of the cysJI operon
VLYQEGSFSGAAEKLFLTEPAVYRQISSLQQSLGIKLVSIKKGKAVLSPAGEILIKYAEKIYLTSQEAQKEIHILRESHLRVGILSVITPMIMPAISRFKSEYPEIKLELKSSTSAELIDELQDLKLDLVVVLSMDKGDKNIEVLETCGTVRSVAVASPSLINAAGKPFKPDNLSRYPVLLPNEHTLACKIFLERLKELNIELNRDFISSIELADIFSRKTIARSGGAIAVFPEPVVTEEIEQGELEIIPLGKDMTVQVEVLVHRGITISSSMRQFSRLICEELISH